MSNIRLRDCINKVPDLIERAGELGYSCIAITDHEAICGHIKAQKYAQNIKEKYPNLKVILGNEIYLVRNGLNSDNFNSKKDRYFHFILLACDEIGHKQIREISTRAWRRSYMARGMRRVPTYYQDIIDIIGSNPGHVIGSSACLGGQLAQKILSNEIDYCRAWCQRMVEIFGEGYFYLEMQPSLSKEQIVVNKQIKILSQELNIPYIITTDAHYLNSEDRFIHKAFLNSQNGDREVDDFYETTFLMNDEQIRKYFSYFTPQEINIAYDNIISIQDKCKDYSLAKPLKIPELLWHKPKSEIINPKWFDLIPEIFTFYNSDYYGDKVLAQLIVERLESAPNDLYLNSKKAYDEINACLEMTRISSNVNKTHWSAYFLNLQRIVDECWNAGTLVGCGRGSGVGFILLYILGITQINPLREKTATFRWRFLNPDRVSVLDVDVDIEGTRRKQILTHLRKVYGEDRVSNVATFGTEKSKSAIQTAARGLDISIEVAQYLSSMIKTERGITQTLNQTFYGDKEADISPNKQFVHEMTVNYPELWKVAQKIEGLINKVGIHAGGVIFVDEDFTESTALMRAPDGTIITQFELHDSEECSLIKYDLLSIEALDKMHICLDLLAEQHYIEPESSLKETYEKVLGIYNIEREDPKMWEMVWNHEINSLFQMEQQSGIQGIALTHPKSVDDLAVLNSVIRLMATEKGAEQPLNKFARYKANINLWYKEMTENGLTPEEQKILEPVVKISYGICEAQEKFMQLVQIPECGGFNLTFADKLRKSIAKKNPKDFEALEKTYFEETAKKGLSPALCNYVWKELVCTSKGYGFNASHTLAYSLVALQEMNLAYKYPVIFWNCACLISDSAGITEEDEDEEELIYSDPVTSTSDLIEEEEIVSIYEEEDDDDEYEYEDLPDRSGKKKKKKNSSIDYGKISTAINKMKSSGICIEAPDINKSKYTFIPDVENNKIIYGLKGITRIGSELIDSIIQNRPYESISDFCTKVKVNKVQVINLIKSGAFDTFGQTRESIMEEYILSIADTKKDLNLRNMQMLITYGLLPDELLLEQKIFNFNKYIKKNCVKDGKYVLEDYPLTFYSSNICDDDLTYIDSNTATIPCTLWDKKYKKYMEKPKVYIKAHKTELLEKLNNILYQEVYDKYCLGSISKWEMDSISYYNHPHELEKIDYFESGLVNFFRLPEEPVVDYTFRTKDGKEIPIYKICRIAGTIINKDKNKKLLQLLTREGVVTVKIFGDAFVKYDKQISEKDSNGKKHIIEKSMLARGNKIIVTGIKRGSSFVAKKYKNTPYPLVQKIERVNDDGTVLIAAERKENS